MMDSMLNHRSIRKYRSQAVEEEKLNHILTAASRASTTGNMQVYSIVVTRSAAIRQQLWEAHFKQNMVLEAPVHLTFCADFNRFSKWCRQRDADPGYDNFLSFFTGAIDALLAAQNAALAAEEQGLVICYLGTVTWMADRFIEILKLPQLVVPVAAITVGYPDEQPPLTPRLPLGSVVHDEVYHDFSAEAIDSLYDDMENLAETQRLLKENNKKTLAQIFTDNRYRRTVNGVFSRKFLEVIAKQGFRFNED